MQHLCDLCNRCVIYETGVRFLQQVLNLKNFQKILGIVVECVQGSRNETRADRKAPLPPGVLPPSIDFLDWVALAWLLLSYVWHPSCW